MIHATTLLQHCPQDAEAWEYLGYAQTTQNKYDERVPATRKPSSATERESAATSCWRNF